jgi:chromosome segregation ATPase
MALTMAGFTLASQQDDSLVSAGGANPIRKVVNMLKSMQEKCTAEGVKEKELFDKFMCYCKTSGKELKGSMAAADVKMPQLASSIKESEESLVQTKAELKQAQTDRAEAKSAMAEASALREKEAKAFAAEKAERDANIGAMKSAIRAIEAGMVGSFLQTTAASSLQKLALSNPDISEEDRRDVLAFLSQGHGDDAGYTPSGGEVTGILKEMEEGMSKSLADATASEKAAVKAYGDLMAAKTKEVNALTAAIESKTMRVGELGVSIVQMKNDLTETEAGLIADQKFLAETEESCKTKASEWEERVKTRSEELAALAETIKILNDDDALELFKKTLPGTSASFVQVGTKGSSVAAAKAQALADLSPVLRRQGGTSARYSPAELIALALRGKTVGFAKVIAMIDAMVATLKKEQQDDDDKKEFCAMQFDLSEDKKKGLETSISDLETSAQSAEEGIATLKEEIKDLESGIKALDKLVAESTEQRKEEHEEYKELLASDSAALELLGFAKNRLNKFYNPKLYKAPPKRDLSEEDTMYTSFGGSLAPTEAPGGIAGTGVTVFAQINSHVHKRGAPPPPPETYGAYKTKSEENTGVIAMMDLLIKDLEKELTEAKTEEADAQNDYEKALKDSVAKRMQDSATLTEKEATKASLESDLESYKENHASAGKELMAVEQYISNLHAECDWLLKYFDVRKEARAEEVDALKNAKAVLSGADFSLVQTKARGFLEPRSQ